MWTRGFPTERGNSMAKCPTCGCDRVDRFCAQCGRSVFYVSRNSTKTGAGSAPALKKRPGGLGLISMMMLVGGGIAAVALHSEKQVLRIPSPREVSDTPATVASLPDFKAPIRTANGTVITTTLGTKISLLRARLDEYRVQRLQVVNWKERLTMALQQARYQGRRASFGGRDMDAGELHSEINRAESWLNRSDSLADSGGELVSKLEIVLEQGRKHQLAMERTQSEMRSLAGQGSAGDQQRRARLREQLADLDRILSTPEVKRDLPVFTPFEFGR